MADSDLAQMLELARDTSAAFIRVNLHAGSPNAADPPPFTGQDTAEVAGCDGIAKLKLSIKHNDRHLNTSSVLA